MRIAVLSDTHAPRFWKQLPDDVAAHLDNVDRIFHAGDVCQAFVLDELSQFAPVHVVMGNNDGPDVAQWGATETFEVEIDGVSFAMIHDSGPATGRLNRMQKLFPNANCVVYGHSHIPMHEQTDDGSFRIFNPGSPTDKRRQPHKTMGMIEITDGRIAKADIIALG